MEAGLACPDWPLCYGSFLPLKHMNIRVFLEWFHRLDAFILGILILSKFILSLIWSKEVPNWLPKTYSLLLFLVLVQGSLGALTVINLLNSYTVSGHLLIAFLLLILTISINQNLEYIEIKETKETKEPFIGFKLLLCAPLILTLIQSFIGVRVASTWSSHLCLSFNKQCLILDTHKLFAFPITFSILSIIAISIYKQTLFLKNWKYLSSLLFLLISQIVLGVLSLKTNLNEPIFIIGHQLNASLLVAILTSLIFRTQFTEKELNQSLKTSILGINT